MVTDKSIARPLVIHCRPCLPKHESSTFSTKTPKELRLLVDSRMRSSSSTRFNACHMQSTYFEPRVRLSHGHERGIPPLVCVSHPRMQWLRTAKRRRRAIHLISCLAADKQITPFQDPADCPHHWLLCKSTTVGSIGYIHPRFFFPSARQAIGLQFFRIVTNDTKEREEKRQNKKQNLIHKTIANLHRRASMRFTSRLMLSKGWRRLSDNWCCMLLHGFKASADPRGLRLSPSERISWRRVHRMQAL